MRRLKAACGTILAVALVATGIAAMSASAGDNEAGENQLVGAWFVSVNRGPTLPR